MSSYIQLLFRDISAAQSEILIAALDEAGFEGFEEEEKGLKAFVASDRFNETAAGEIAVQAGVSFSKSVIEETNWNELWESNFPPVVVDDFVVIRAHFHESPRQRTEHEIVITPKMSFGTGHHATTYMMMRQMREIDFTGRSVLDFGTGTGILAILAVKLGASRVTALDNDEWSIANCRENILQNKALSIEVIKSDSARLDEQFDVIVANINRNVILDNASVLAGQLAPGGILVISGLLHADEKDILERMRKEGLHLLKKTGQDNWVSMKLGC